MSEEYDKQGMIKAYVNLGIQFNEANARIKELEDSLESMGRNVLGAHEDIVTGQDEIKALREEVGRLQLHVDDYNKVLPENKALREALEFIHKQLEDKDSETVGWKDYILIKAKTMAFFNQQALKKDEANNGNT